LREQLHRTPSLSPQRIVMIDAAEDMEAGAANALLKILEEPPANTMFFLISHMPGRLLPTIRSRCRLVRLRPLGDEQVARIVAEELPELDMESCMALAQAAQGSPGQALQYADLDVAGIEAVLLKVESGDPQAAAGRSTLARQMASKGAQPRFELFLDYFPSRLARAVRQSSGEALAEGITLWERACELANSARRLSLDPESTVYELTGYLAAFTASRLNMSRKP
jgi:DNA polymerase-3 subunit delta'